MTQSFQISVIVLLASSLVLAEALPPLAVWANSPQPEGADRALLKVAAFHRSGTATPKLSPAELKKTCGGPLKHVAWVAHRLQPGERLDRKAGVRLGEELEALLRKGCFEGVSLNMEPLPTPPAWLPAFLQGIRSALALPLSMAVPPISEGKHPGLTWTRKETLNTLAHLDGLDFMIYDTGESKAAYQKIVHQTISVAAVQATWNKTLTFGLPAYPDKTKLHPAEVENLKTLNDILQRLPMDRAYCGPRRRLAVYAAWTWTDQDRAWLEKIRRRWAKECR